MFPLRKTIADIHSVEPANRFCQGKAQPGGAFFFRRLVETVENKIGIQCFAGAAIGNGNNGGGNGNINASVGAVVVESVFQQVAKQHGRQRLVHLRVYRCLFVERNRYMAIGIYFRIIGYQLFY